MPGPNITYPTFSALMRALLRRGDNLDWHITLADDARGWRLTGIRKPIRGRYRL